MRPPVFDPSHPVHSFDFITSANGPECSRCGAYQWGADGSDCGVPVKLDASGHVAELNSRTCTDCGVLLPKYLLNGSIDDFPCCSTHAF